MAQVVELRHVQLRCRRTGGFAAGNLEAVHYRITQLLIRLDALLEEVSTMARRLLDAGERAGLQGLVAYAVDKWTRLARAVQDGPTQGRA